MSNLLHPYGLALYGGYLYWTDWTSQTIQRVSKTTGGGQISTVSGIGYMNAIQGQKARLTPPLATPIFFYPCPPFPSRTISAVVSLLFVQVPILVQSTMADYATITITSAQSKMADYATITITSVCSGYVINCYGNV